MPAACRKLEAVSDMAGPLPGPHRSGFQHQQQSVLASAAALKADVCMSACMRNIAAAAAPTVTVHADSPRSPAPLVELDPRTICLSLCRAWLLTEGLVLRGVSPAACSGLPGVTGVMPEVGPSMLGTICTAPARAAAEAEELLVCTPAGRR